MANEEHVGILQQGVEAWNDWRRENPGIPADLTGARLSGVNLTGADLAGADLTEAFFLMATLTEALLGTADLSRATLSRVSLNRATLTGATLTGATLTGATLTGATLTGARLAIANLSEANLSSANLGGANLSMGTNLRKANLTGAHLGSATLEGTDLTGATLSGVNLIHTILREVSLAGADLSEVNLSETIFADVDLSGCRGLERCTHSGPSVVDIRTLQRSGPLPLSFLRGVGLPDKLIEYLPAILEQAIQHYSCFISYAAKDDDFARRLHADLQNKSVRCWFAPEDMKIGAKILDTLDQAIRLRDKLLLVLSEASIASDWVEDEVTRAFAEERDRRTTVLFPVMIDDVVFTTKEACAVKLREGRNIGDFRTWKDHDAYQRTLTRLLRDLRVETPDASASSAGQTP
jgi:uncharacterized protein YjbI with pentapeptide repeats